MLRVGFAPIRPDKESRLRGWMAELQSRASEVRESFVRETVRHEQVFIVEAKDGPLLVYVIEAEDHGTARTAYASSELAIDKEHQAVLDECLKERLRLEPVFDCLLAER